MKKRLKKKQVKKALQKKAMPYASKLGLSKKDVEKANIKTLENIPKKAKSEQRKKQRKALYEKKINLLKQQGYDTSRLTKKESEHIRLKDIQNKKVRLKDYPQLFDFNKVKKFSPNRHFYISYWDYTGERSFEDILSDFQNLSDDELLKRLKNIVNMPKTFSKYLVGSGSSGSAGEAVFYHGDSDIIKRFDRDMKNDDERWKNHPKRKRHGGQFKGHQVLTDENGHIDIGEATGHSLLVIINAVMRNVTEENRDIFYRDITTFLRRSFIDFYRLLPKLPYRK